MTPRQTRAALVAMIALGGPTLFGLDLVARHFIFENLPDDAAALMGPIVTRYAWWVVPGPLAGGVIGFRMYAPIVRRQLAKAPAGQDPGLAFRNADLMGLMFAASAPQLPALLGDMSVMLGGSVIPALCTMTISTVAVLLIALVAPRRLAPSPHSAPAPAGAGPGAPGATREG